jgi:hypothetical protein
MMRSIIEGTLAAQPDMSLVGHCRYGELLEVVAEREAEILIVTEDADRPEASFTPLLLTFPSLKVVMLAQDGAQAALLELRRIQLVDVSPDSLVEGIRAAWLEGESPTPRQS